MEKNIKFLSRMLETYDKIKFMSDDKRKTIEKNLLEDLKREDTLTIKALDEKYKDFKVTTTNGRIVHILLI